MKLLGVIASNVFICLAMLAGWQMQSPATVAAAALIGASLTGVMFADFSRFRASGPAGFQMEAERQAARVEKALAEVAASAELDASAGDDQTTADAEWRVAIENLIAEASEWGWMAARGDAGQVPKPIVQWSSDGQPRLGAESS